MKLVLYIAGVRTQVWKLKMPKPDKTLSTAQNFLARQDYVNIMVALGKAEYPEIQILKYHFNIEVKAKVQPRDLEERKSLQLKQPTKILRPAAQYSNRLFP